MGTKQVKIEAFEKYSNDYEQWFVDNEFVYHSELAAIKYFLDNSGKNIEIGIGTGKFAEPLNIGYGIEPSPAMIKKISGNCNIPVIRSIAEHLPLKNNIFDTALLITTICFVDDASQAIAETMRILRNSGQIIIAFIDSKSPLGELYQKNKEKSKFYSQAKFYSTGEIVELLVKHKFKNIRIIQTIFGDYKKIKSIQNFKDGYGEGNFIVIKGEKN
ncbi:class I SAM-dependent methyltransferase [Candidatus Dependentiae bacterium]|nr:class I SAM-dependent methyltransferase [Candidatus Dependentiae bacterium]